MHPTNTVQNTGEADCVVRPCPKLAGDGKSGRHSAVDIGEFVWLNVTVGPPGADKGAEFGRNLLFEIHAHAAAALILGLLDGSDVGRAAGDRCQINRIFKGTHTPAAEETGDRDLAGMPP